MPHITDHALPTYTWAGPDSSYLRRAKFMKEHRLPGLDTITLRVGASLADVFLSSASGQLRQELGLEPVLEGPRGQMLVEAKNALKGKKIVTEAGIEARARQHTAILEIGQKIEDKFAKAYEEELKEAVERKKEEMLKIMEDKINAAVSKKKSEMEELYRVRLKAMRREIIQQFSEYLEERDRYICSLADDKIRNSLEILRGSMKEELELAVIRRARHANESCLFINIWDKNKAQEMLAEKISELKKRWTRIMENAVKSSEIERKELENTLKERHESDLMSQEAEFSQRLEAAVAEGTAAYRADIERLEGEVTRLKSEQESLSKEKELLELEQYSWCFLLKELLRQFSKCLSSTLQEYPIFTEHLISLEKLLQARSIAVSQPEFIKGFVKAEGTRENVEERLKEEREWLASAAAKEVQGTIPCIPPDDVIHFPNVMKEKERDAVVGEIWKILDSMIRITVPSDEGSCFKLSRESSSGVEEEEAPPIDPCFRVLPDRQSRVDLIVSILDKHPALKRAIITH